MSKYVTEYEDVFSPQVLDSVLKRLYKERASENDDFVIQKKDLQLHKHWQSDWQHIEYKALKLAETYLKQTYSQLPVSALRVNHIGFKTDPEGAFTQLHYDWEMNQIKDEILMKPFVALVYLTDVEEGGGCFFPLENLTVEPKKGKVVIFPCCFAFPHVTIPVAKGTKELMRITFGMDLSYYQQPSGTIEF
jgi:hypothetical protein